MGLEKVVVGDGDAVALINLLHRAADSIMAGIGKILTYTISKNTTPLLLQL